MTSYTHPWRSCPSDGRRGPGAECCAHQCKQITAMERACSGSRGPSSRPPSQALSPCPCGPTPPTPVDPHPIGPLPPHQQAHSPHSHRPTPSPHGPTPPTPSDPLPPPPQTHSPTLAGPLPLRRHHVHGAAHHRWAQHSQLHVLRVVHCAIHPVGRRRA